MKREEFLILGCGFTGKRVAARLLERGARVVCTTRQPDTLVPLAAKGAEVHRLDFEDADSLLSLGNLVSKGAFVLHSVPLIRHWNIFVDPTQSLLAALDGVPSRVIYLSTTGVYGETHFVDEKTLPAPVTMRQSLRVEAESAVKAGRWSWMILRPAAIYGEGRGVHESMRSGRYRLAGDGSGYVSRIHVDDLAAHVVAALLSDANGAYPVADEEPAAAREVVEFCARLMRLEMPPCADKDDVSETLRFDRRVDGSAVRRLLGVSLTYPNYRMGISAVLEAERRGKGDLTTLREG